MSTPIGGNMSNTQQLIDWVTNGKDNVRLLDKITEQYPIQGAIIRRMLSIPRNEADERESRLRRLEGVTCRVKYSHERRQEEKEAEIAKAIRARQRRKQKKC